MPQTYSTIATQTIGTATNTFNFDSIPQTYTDLVLIANYATSVNNEDALMRFNGDTSSIYSYQNVQSNGSSTSSGAAYTQTYYWIDRRSAGTSITTPLQSMVNIMSYSNTSIFKNILHKAGTLGGSFTGIELSGGQWRSTSAITSITILTTTGNFVVGSSFALYGIKAA